MPSRVNGPSTHEALMRPDSLESFPRRQMRSMPINRHTLPQSFDIRRPGIVNLSWCRPRFADEDDRGTTQISRARAPVSAAYQARPAQCWFELTGSHEAAG